MNHYGIQLMYISSYCFIFVSKIERKPVSSLHCSISRLFFSGAYDILGLFRFVQYKTLR